MPNEPLAELSNTLFLVALAAYVVATVGYFFRLAFTRVSPQGLTAPTVTGQRIGVGATALTLGAAGLHVGSIITRGLAAQRPPLLNMYEFSSLIALLAVAIAVGYVQWRLGRSEVVGFVLAAAVLMMGSALLLYGDPGPVQPALNSWWRWIHITSIGFAWSVFMVGFAFAALYLVKDTAERRSAATSSYGDSTVGAAEIAISDVDVDDLQVPEAVGGRVADAPTGDQPGGDGADGADRMAQRRTLSLRLFAAVPAAGAGLLGLAIHEAGGAAAYAAIGGGIGALTWWSVPFLPPAATLDTIAYRVNAFGFPLWTFAVIMGAVWAEVTWGRYWGWDPKETSAFFTWVFYAGYLHARATRGWQGRRAAWVNVVAFASLVVTYYVVNLVVSGLHSYAKAGA